MEMNSEEAAPPGALREGVRHTLRYTLSYNLLTVGIHKSTDPEKKLKQSL